VLCEPEILGRDSSSRLIVKFLENYIVVVFLAIEYPISTLVLRIMTVRMAIVMVFSTQGKQTTDMPPVTDKLYRITLYRVHFAMSGIRLID